MERVYQKKTQLEHILLRPDAYIGSVEPVIQVCPASNTSGPQKRSFVVPGAAFVSLKLGIFIPKLAFVSANVGF